MLRRKVTKTLYRGIVRPLLFRLDPDRVHHLATNAGERFENNKLLIQKFLGEPLLLPKKVLGISYPNPIGLAAGFDYNGHLAQMMGNVGFGFNTVGTVTANPSHGNPGPQLARLPKSQSILVNKGFRSDGAVMVARRLDEKNLSNRVIGISVGSSNLPTVDTVSKAIDDYLETFSLFQTKPYTTYFELNISCPNTILTESFAKTENFTLLTAEILKLNLRQPIFVKMPSEINAGDAEALVRIGLSAGIRGYIFSNLVKNRSNELFHPTEIARYATYKGNFSGRPTAAGALSLTRSMRKKFGQDIALISCGGVFSPADALERLLSGADLIELITGMIYEGPQLINDIVAALADQTKMPRTESGHS